MMKVLMPHCRVAALPHVFLTFENKSEIKHEKACISQEFFVPLHCQNESRRGRPLKIKIARLKSRNCAH